MSKDRRGSVQSGFAAVSSCSCDVLCLSVTSPQSVKRQDERLLDRLARPSAGSGSPSAPSMTRWSYESDSGSISRGSNSPVLVVQTGSIAPREMPRIATSGALTIGRERRAADAAQVRDAEAAALHLVERDLARARFLRQLRELDRRSAMMFFVSASRMTGTSSPRSVSTATPMLTYFL